MAEREKVSKADLRQEIAELRHVGGQMANLCFNLSQEGNISYDRREVMRRLYRDWDLVARREGSAWSEMPEVERG